MESSKPSTSEAQPPIPTSPETGDAPPPLQSALPDLLSQVHITDPPLEPMDEKVLKCIIKHMRVNTRLQLSQHIPKIRALEASVPLHMERLVFSSPSEFILENVIFHVNYCSESELFADDPKEGSDDKSPWMVVTMKSKRYSKMQKFRKLNATPTTAMEYLVSKFFGGRPAPISVDCLGLEHKGPFRGFPRDMAFKINDLKITHDTSACIEAILPFLDPSSFPLDTVFIKGGRTKSSGKYDHPHIASARYLHIMDSSGCKYWSKKIAELENKQIHLQCPDVGVEEFFWILEMYVKNGKPPGTWISIGMDKFEDVKGVMKGVKKINSARTEPSGMLCSTFTEAIVLPLADARELAVYVSQNENLATHDRQFSQFDLNLCIFPLGPPQ